jgi:hypothetical protein
MPRVQLIKPQALRQVIDVDGELVLTGNLDVPNPAILYATDHPMVRAYPWAFASPEAVADAREAGTAAVSVPVEAATAAPGEKRSTRRAR